MARVLFSSTAGAGHFTPLVPFVRAFAGAGHEVVVTAPEALRETAVATGAAFEPFGDPPGEEMDAVMSGLPRLGVDEANAVVCREIFGRLDATAALPALLDLMERWSPDLVVRETAEFGSAIAAELSGVPQARVGIGLLAAEEVVLGHAAPSVDALRRVHGLPGDPDGSAVRATPFATLFPAGLEHGSAPEGVLRFRSPTPPVSAGRMPAPRPLVYLTFGTVAARLPHLEPAYATAVAAMEGLDADVLLTLGKGVDPGFLGAVPDHVRVEAWVDQADVLAAASVVVCHGGGGTTLGTLGAGLPLVVVPLFALDQFINARRVAEVGAGLEVLPDAAAIHEAVREVLGNPAYRRASGELAEEMAALPGVDEAPAALLETVRARESTDQRSER